MIKPKNNFKNLKKIGKNAFLTKLQVLRNVINIGENEQILNTFQFLITMRCFDTKTAACFLSVKVSCLRCCMSMFLICSFLKSRTLDGLKKQYLQLNIKGCCMLCLKEKQPILLEKGVTKLYLRI